MLIGLECQIQNVLEYYQLILEKEESRSVLSMIRNGFQPANNYFSIRIWVGTQDNNFQTIGIILAYSLILCQIHGVGL